MDDCQVLQVSVFVLGLVIVQMFYWEGCQISWIVFGDQSWVQVLSVVSSIIVCLLLIGIDVEVDVCSVVVIGDLIIDGVIVSFDQDQCWIDYLVVCLVVWGIVVVNVGIFGGWLLCDGMGEFVLVCFWCDVLDQFVVFSVIVLIGINDISWFGIVFVWNQVWFMLVELQVGYCVLVEQVCYCGVWIIGVILLLFVDVLFGMLLDDYYYLDKDVLC